MNQWGNCTWIGQRDAGYGCLTWSRYTVFVHWRQQTRECCQRFTQFRIADVVAMSGHRTIRWTWIAGKCEIFALRFQWNRRYWTGQQRIYVQILQTVGKIITENANQCVCVERLTFVTMNVVQRIQNFVRNEFVKKWWVRNAKSITIGFAERGRSSIRWSGINSTLWKKFRLKWEKCNWCSLCG